MLPSPKHPSPCTANVDFLPVTPAPPSTSQLSEGPQGVSSWVSEPGQLLLALLSGALVPGALCGPPCRSGAQPVQGRVLWLPRSESLSSYNVWKGSVLPANI